MNSRYFRLFLRIMAVIIPGLVGVFLGFKAGLLYTNAYSQGRFEPWRKIAQPPGKVIKFLAAGEDQLYVNTSGGIFFAPNVDALIGHVPKQSWVKVEKVSHLPICYLFYDDYHIPAPLKGSSIVFKLVMIGLRCIRSIIMCCWIMVRFGCGDLGLTAGGRLSRCSP